MPKPKKNAFTIGLETMLNDKRTSPFNPDGAKTFKSILDASELPMSEVFKHIGKGKKAQKKAEADRSKERVEKLEQDNKEEC